MVLSAVMLTACHDDADELPAGGSHTEAVVALQNICNENAEVKRLLEHAIAQAATVNPDRNDMESVFQDINQRQE